MDGFQLHIHNKLFLLIYSNFSLTFYRRLKVTYERTQSLKSSSNFGAFPGRSCDDGLRLPAKNQAALLFHNCVTLTNISLSKPFLRLHYHLHRRRLKPSPAHSPAPLVNLFMPLHPGRPLAAYYVLYFLGKKELLYLIRSPCVIFGKHCI